MFRMVGPLTPVFQLSHINRQTGIVFMSFSCFSAVWPQTHTAGLQRHCKKLVTLRPLACRRHQEKVDVGEFDIPNILKLLLHKLLCKMFNRECWHVVSASLPQCPLHMGYGPCWPWLQPFVFDEPNEDFLKTSLKYWATSYSVSLVALSSLLSILRVFHPTLPKDARTCDDTCDYTNSPFLVGIFCGEGKPKILSVPSTIWLFNLFFLIHVFIHRI